MGKFFADHPDRIGPLIRTIALGLAILAAPAGPLAGAEQPSEAPSPAVLQKYKSILEEKPEEGTVLDRLWQLYDQNATVQELLTEYRTKVSENPKNARLHQVLALLEKKAGNLDAARSELQKAVDLEPGEPRSWQSLAELQAGAGDPAAAVESLRKAISLTPAGAAIPLYQKMGEIELRRNHVEDAVRAYEKTAELDPQNVQIHLQLAKTYEEANLPDRALPHYQAVVERGEPFQRCLAWRQIGATHEKENHFEEARDAYEKGLELTSEGNWVRAELEHKLIDLYESKNRVPELAERIQKRIAAEPSHLEHRLFLAQVFATQNELGKEIEVLEGALQVSPDSPQLHKALAEACRDHGDYERAAREFETLFKLDEKYLENVRDGADMWFEAQKPAEATRFWEAALAEHGPDADWYLAAAEFHLGKKLNAPAEKFFLKAIEAQPGHPRALEALGQFYFDQGRKDQAISIWNRMVIPAEKEDVRLAQKGKVAELLESHGLLNEAKKARRELVDSRPQEPSLRAAYGKLLAETGDFQESAAQFQKAIALTPDLKAKLQALDELLESLERNAKESDALAAWTSQRETLCRAEPTEENVLFLARAYARQRKWPAAVKLLGEFTQAHPDDVPVLREYAEMTSRAGQFDAAEATWNKLREKDAGEAKTYLARLVQVKLDQKKPSEALTYAREIVALHPQLASSYVTLAEVNQQAHLPNAAVDAMKEAVRREPQSFELHRRYSEMLQKYGRYDEAQAELLGMLDISNEMGPRLDVIQELVGLALKRSKLEQLAQDFRERLDRSPRDYFLRLANAEILRVLGDDQGAYRMLQSALQYNRDPQEALGRLLSLAYEENDLPSAIHYQLRLMKMMKEPDATAFLKLAELQEEAGQGPASEETWNQIRRRFQNDELVLRSLADHYRGKPDDAAALEVYQQITRLNPKDYAAWVESGKLALKCNNIPVARASFERVLELPWSKPRPGQLLLPPLTILEEPYAWMEVAPLRAPGSHAPAMNTARRLSRSAFFANSPSVDLQHTPASLDEARLMAIAHLVSLSKGPELVALERLLSRSSEDPGAPQDMLLFLVLTQNRDRAMRLLSQLTVSQPGNFALRKFYLHAAAVWNRVGDVLAVLNDQTPGGPPPRESLYEIIDVLLGLEDTEQALTLARQIVDKYSDLDTQGELIQIFADRQKYPEAIQLARVILAKNPQSVASMQYRSMLVEWLAMSGETPEAAELARGALHEDQIDLISDQDSKVRVLAQVPFLFDDAELDKITAELPAELEKESSPLDRAATLGVYFAVIGEDQKAEPYLREVARLKADNLDFLREACNWFEQHQLLDASRIFWEASREALNRMPGSEVVAAQVKELKRRQWDFLLQSATEEEVNRQLAAALADPNADPQGLQELAQQLRNYQYIEQAAKVWRALVQAQPDQPVFRQQLLELDQQTGDYGDAIQLAKKELQRVKEANKGNESHPEYRQALERLYSLQEEAGRLQELAIELEGRNAKFPDDPEVLRRLARVYEQLNEEKKLAAIQQSLDRVARAFPAGPAQNSDYRLENFQAQGDVARALAEAESLYRRDPSKRDAMIPTLINLYFQTDQQEKALRMVRKVRAQRSSAEAARIYRAVAYQLQTRERWKEAAEFWKMAAHHSPAFSESYGDRVQLVNVATTRLNDFELADRELQELEAAPESDGTPQFLQVLQLRLALEEKRNTLPAYCERLEKKLQAAPTDERVLWSLLQAYQAANRPEKRQAIVAQLKAGSIEDELILAKMGGLLREQRDWAGVEKIDRALLMRQPRNVHYYTDLADAVLNQGRKADAEKILKRLERINPNAADGEIAQFYLAHDLTADALQFFDRAVAKPRGYRDLPMLQQYAETLARHKEYEKARDVYRKIFSYAQGRQASFSSLVQLYRDWNRLDQVLPEFGTEVRKMPFSARQQFFQQLIIALKEEGQYSKATQLYEQEKMPFSGSYFYDSVAEAYVALDDLDRAAAALQEALSREPANQAWAQRLAEILWKSAQRAGKEGDLHAPEPYLAKACKLQPANQQIHSELAKLYEKRREFSKAVEVYQELEGAALSTLVKKSCQDEIERLRKLAAAAPAKS